MKNMSVSERGVRLENLFSLSPRAGYTLNMTVVYHDENTQAWAHEVHNKVSKAVGKDSLRATWWKIEDLGQPGVLAGAVSTAMRADMIVAAVDTAEGLPLPFNIWVNTWLPYRINGSGCLIGLLGMPGKSHPGAQKAAEYLKAVAQQGRLEFILEKRVQPSALIHFPRVQMLKHAATGLRAKARDRRVKWAREIPARSNIFAPAVATF